MRHVPEVAGEKRLSSDVVSPGGGGEAGSGSDLERDVIRRGRTVGDGVAD